MSKQMDSGAALQKGRIIWVSGGKGGVGKSTFARGILDVLLNAGVAVAAYDGDPDNAQLFRFYQEQGMGVKKLALDTQGAADGLLDAMEARKAQVFLIDVAAGGSKTLQDLENDIGLISEAAAMGYGFTVVSVLSRIKDSVNLLKLTLGMTEGLAVDLIAVRNLYFGDDGQFALFDESMTKQRLIERGGRVVDMPILFANTYEILDRQNLPFSTAVSAPTSVVPRAHRTRVYKWLQALDEALLDGDLQGVLGR
ncbi:MAG: hypothetical protein AAF703_17025 [Cyanobacteria bacterium P01_D01_bin.105]